MNVFVLSTGRCGSETFARACAHMTNYTAAHESRALLLGEERLDYPPNHIESDNRLCWFLGRLDEAFGADAFYVHLTRDRRGTAESYNRRWNHHQSIVRAYADDILMTGDRSLEVCLDYWDTVNANIRSFVKDKPNRMDFRLETAPEDFRAFWERVGAKGDLDKALAEWNVRHNVSRSDGPAVRALRKTARLVTKLPNFIRDA